MKNYIISGFAAALLGGCTSYGSRTYDRGYHDTGGYYAGRDRETYDSGGYNRGSEYDDRQHHQQAQSATVVVNERNTAQVNRAQVSHGTSATVSHGHNGNKAAVGSSTKPAKSPSAGKHPPEKTSKSEKKTE
jgi:hypothetical protein